MADLMVRNLPMPPRLSDLTTNVPGRGRVATAKYERWKRSAAPFVNLAGKAVSGAVAVEIFVYPGKDFNPLTSDLANREKAVTDLLVSCGKIEDDKAQFVRRISLVLGSGNDPKKLGWVDVGVTSLEDREALS